MDFLRLSEHGGGGVKITASGECRAKGGAFVFALKSVFAAVGMGDSLPGHSDGFRNTAEQQECF